jgi:hypothetical protein
VTLEKFEWHLTQSLLSSHAFNNWTMKLTPLPATTAVMCTHRQLRRLSGKRWAAFQYVLVAAVISLVNLQHATTRWLVKNETTTSAHQLTDVKATWKRNSSSLSFPAPVWPLINESSVSQNTSNEMEWPLAIEPNVPQNISNEMESSVQVGTDPLECRFDGTGPMIDMAKKYFLRNSNAVCERIKQERANPNELIPLTVNVSIPCQDLFQNGMFGTGNYITMIYGFRLAAAVHVGVGFNLACTDADATKKDLILPWITGWYPPRSVETPSPYPMVSLEQSCHSLDSTQISHMYQEMQFDFRRMAIGLVGVPSKDHPSANFAKQYLSSHRDKNLHVKVI